MSDFKPLPIPQSPTPSMARRMAQRPRRNCWPYTLPWWIRQTTSQIAQQARATAAQAAPITHPTDGSTPD